MSNSIPGTSPSSPQTANDNIAGESIVTLASIGIVASVLGDLTHEVLGHMTVGLFSKDQMTMLASVGLQTVGTGDTVLSSAGTVANVLVGAAALLFLFRRGSVLKATTAYFLLVFGTFNLLNTVYLVYSAIAKQGDWARVISDLSPEWFWRLLLGASGIALYALSVSAVQRVTAATFAQSGLSPGQLRRLLLTPYLSGAAVMTLAAVFNPFSWTLILISGIGASLAANWGFLIAGRRVETTQNAQVDTTVRPVNLPWLITALIIAGLFVGVLGPGLCLHNCAK
jgi:hypothetical protein